LGLTDAEARLVRVTAWDGLGATQAVREWTTAWDNPAVDIVATSLLASLEGRIEIETDCSKPGKPRVTYKVKRAETTEQTA
jgi:hypothetical protein